MGSSPAPAESERERLIGISVPRVDGMDKAEGRTLFLDDLRHDGILHGKVIRSSIARGRLKSLKFLDGIDWSGFVIVTAQDIPGVNIHKLHKDDQVYLVEDAINHKGEAIALLAHPSVETLKEAERFIAIEYEEAPAVLCLDDALQEGETLCALKLERGYLDETFRNPDYQIISGEYRTGHQEHLYLEPQGMIARYCEGRLKVMGSMQCPYYVKDALDSLLAMDVEVEQTATGGAFGGKEEYPSMIAGYAALLAWKSGGTVKLVYDRREDMLYTTKRHPSITRYRTACTREGRIAAQDIEIILDGGAYTTLSDVVLMRAVLHAAGAYKTPAIRIRGRVLKTNTSPNGAFRGFGAPQVFFGIESHLDRIAAQCGLSAEEVREINRLRSGDILPSGEEAWDGERIGAVFHRALEVSSFRGKKAEFEAFNRNSPWRKKGIAMALFFHGSGFTGKGEEMIAAVIELAVIKGPLVEIRVSSVEMGQGEMTVLRQIAADSLGIPIAMVTTSPVNTTVVPNTGPTVASRTTMMVGMLIRRAALKMKVKMGDDSLRGLRENTGFSIRERYVPPPGISWDDERLEGKAYPAYSWACYVSEVEVCLQTYRVFPQKVWAVQDIGTVVNPLLARGQVEGGVVQGIGYGLYEQVSLRDGLMENASLSGYTIMTSKDIPEVEVHFVESPDAVFPFKGVGELPHDGAAVSVTNAVAHAIGKGVDAIPVMPWDIMTACEEGAKSAGS